MKNVQKETKAITVLCNYSGCVAMEVTEEAYTSQMNTIRDHIFMLF